MGGAGGEVAERPMAEDERQEPERQIDPEHEAPAQPLDEKPARHRPADTGDRPDTAEISLIPAALPGRDDIGDDRLRHADEPAAAQPLKGARRDELKEILRQRGEDRGRHENHDRDLEKAPPAIEIAQFAIEGGGGGGSQEIGGHDPGKVLRAAKLPHHGRQGGRDNGLIERRQHEAQHHPAQSAENLAMAQGAILDGHQSSSPIACGFGRACAIHNSAMRWFDPLGCWIGRKMFASNQEERMMRFSQWMVLLPLTALAACGGGLSSQDRATLNSANQNAEAAKQQSAQAAATAQQALDASRAAQTSATDAETAAKQASDKADRMFDHAQRK